MSYKKRVTTRLTGSTKTAFENLLNYKDEKQSTVLRHLVNTHPEIIEMKKKK
jgi:hypothetical protein